MLFLFLLLATCFCRNPLPESETNALSTVLESIGVLSEVIRVMVDRATSGTLCEAQEAQQANNPSGIIFFTVTANSIEEEYMLYLECDPETVAESASSHTNLYSLSITRDSAFVSHLPDIHPGLGGSLHPDISQFKHLNAFSCVGCGLTGTIPSLFFTESMVTTNPMPSLQTLVLAHNRLSGTLPPWFFSNAAAQVLTGIDLSFNELSGTLPASYLVRDLDNLDLSYNLLSGEIPPISGAVLTSTALYGNRFSGKLPEVEEGMMGLVSCRLVSTGGCEDEMDPSMCPSRESNCFRCSDWTEQDWTALETQLSAEGGCYIGSPLFSVATYCKEKEQRQDTQCDDGMYVEDVMGPPAPGSMNDDDESSDGAGPGDGTTDVGDGGSPPGAPTVTEPADSVNVPLIAGASAGALCVCVVCVAIAVAACTVVRKSSGAPPPRASVASPASQHHPAAIRPGKQGTRRISRHSSRTKTHVSQHNSHSSAESSGRGHGSARDATRPPAFATIGNVAPPPQAPHSAKRRSRANSFATQTAQSRDSLATSAHSASSDYVAPAPSDYHAPSPPNASGYTEPAYARYEYDVASSPLQ